MEQMVRKGDSTNSVVTISWLSIIVNILLFALKYWVGIVSGSVAIIADAWHSLSDSATSLIVLLSAKFSSRPADKNHPFGHGRADLIGSLIIGTLLGVVAFEMLMKSITELFNHQKAIFNLFAIIVIAVSVVVKEIMAQISFYIARRTGNDALRADGWHHRSDSISSIIILIGIIFGGNIWWMDGFMGIIVSIMLFYATFMVFKNAVSKLLGESPDNKTIKTITSICREESEYNINPHHFHIHSYGAHKELTFHINISKEISLCDAHKTTSRIEKRIQDELKLDPTIRIEPL